MKKPTFIIIIIASFFCLLQAGCSQTQSPLPTSTTLAATTTTSTTTTTVAAAAESPYRIIIDYPFPSTTLGTSPSTTSTILGTSTSTILGTSTSTILGTSTSTLPPTTTTIVTTTLPGQTTTTVATTTTIATTTTVATTTTIATTTTVATTTTTVTSTTLPGGADRAITGAFIALDGSNSGWTQSRWNNELGWLKEAGMETIIIQASKIEQTTYYEPVEKILNYADANNIDVHVGLFLTNSWWNNTDPDYLDLLTSSCEAVAQQLWAQFGGRSSFKGMYIPEEIDNITWNGLLGIRLANRFLKPVSDYVKGLNSNLVVSQAPFFNAYIAGGQQPADYQVWWTNLLALVPNLDLVIPQDGIGAGHANLSEMAAYYNALREACAANGRDLWSDLEIYESPTQPVPASIARVSGQIEAEAPLVNKIVCWEWGYYLSPGHSIASFDLYRNYQRYLEGRGALTNVSNGRSYSLSPAASTQYPDSGGELTDNSAPYNWPGQVGWFNNPAVVVTLDLGSVMSNLTDFRAYFFRSDSSGAYLPNTVAVSISNDGSSYTGIGSLTALMAEDETVNPYQLKLDSPVSARYVRYSITYLGGQWLMLSELSVYN